MVSIILIFGALISSLLLNKSCYFQLVNYNQELGGEWLAWILVLLFSFLSEKWKYHKHPINEDNYPDNPTNTKVIQNRYLFTIIVAGLLFLSQLQWLSSGGGCWWSTVSNAPIDQILSIEL